VKIFLSVTSLAARYGGPAYSVGRLASALAERGIEVGLWAPDGSSIGAAGDIVPFIAANPVRKLSGSLRDAVASFGRPNVFHDNGIWMPHNHAIARAAFTRGIPRLVSTRGMLEPWAKAHKRWKKEIAWRVYQRRDLERARGLHATSDVERDNLLSYGINRDVTVIPNGVDIPDPITARFTSEARNPKTALFLGRLYPVKGLPDLVEPRRSDWVAACYRRPRRGGAPR
jgi:glycosyltransferase involved in cell wall biosynthesis